MGEAQLGGMDMFAIIVGTHGRLAEELRSSVEMIFGELQNTAAVIFLPGEGPAEITAKYEAALEKLDTSGGVLFLVDMANTQAMDEGTEIRALMEKAAGAGQKGIRLFHASTVNN